MFRRSHQVFIAIAALATVPGSALAVDFCVTCEGPAAQYTCHFEETASNPDDPRMKLLCITELAKMGPHASCSVDRSRTPPCAGEVRQLALPADAGDLLPDAAQGVTPAAAPPPAAGTPPEGPVESATRPPGPRTTDQQSGTAALPEDGAAPQDSPAQEGPPKTVEEMVKKGADATGNALKETGEAASDAAKKTGSALEQAGSAVGNAAKKTWKCLTTLFSDC